ncbi:aminopeptidase P family protein [Candidatus Peregrinibacteria bacterium]|nr:MAG: aminopeptidase P family protein [Candidatus Peregrinibacteria bacterium]
MRLLTHLTNLRYLIGFTGTAGFMVLTPTKNLFFTDFRYRGFASALAAHPIKEPFEFVELDEEGKAKLKKCFANKTIEFEANHMSISELENWKKRFPTSRFVPAKKTIEEQRHLKTEDEIRKLKKSQQINEATLKAVRKLLKPGVTELEIAWKIKVIGHELGAEDISFEPIVGFGPHSAVPHHQNTATKLKASDLVLIDMGMKFEGYCSDMTRTFLPRNYTNEQASIYLKVLHSQEAAIKALKAGVRCAQLDKIARTSMGKDAEFFGHSLGHGVGLDVHEFPSLSSSSKDVLKENMVVTVEPGIYLDGKFGVRIEDCGRVTKTGYENFMRVEK